MILPSLPLSLSPLRRSRALHCHGWSSCPHPRQLPLRVPMPQTATLLSTLLPLRLLLSLSPPLPPFMPPLPLALVTRSANWTLWKRVGGACLSGNFWLSSFFLLSFACSSQPMHRICPAYCYPPISDSTLYPLFPLFQWFPSQKWDAFERPL